MQKSAIACKLLLTIGLLSLIFGCATTGQQAINQQPAAQEKSNPNQKPSAEEIQAKVVQELKDLGENELAEEEKKAQSKEPPAKKGVHYDIPITINAQVNRWINYYQNKIPKRFAFWLKRSGHYVPMMRGILKQHNLPEDLVYLAMIESGFSCNAYSRAHAVGPWQFIRGTGKRYGLRIDYWVDERRDPVKSTHAAAKYLGDLYNMFGSWYLAAAGYNAGEGKIQRALKRYKADDFWEISSRRRRYLKNETKQYVPKMIAAAIIAKEPRKYGFTNIKYDKPISFDTTKVHPGTSISQAAKLAGISTKNLVALNPELRRWATPPTRSYVLRIPSGSKAAFEKTYAKLSPSQRKARSRAVKVKVQSGDTLGKLAASFGVRLGDLMAMNPNLNPRRLRIGQVVYIPPSGRSKRVRVASKSSRAYKAPHRGKRKIIHRVKKGDTLWDIAQAYGISHKSIKRWNGKRTSRLSIGQKLVLYVPQAKAESKVAPPPRTTTPRASTVYLVRRGDSLWKISRRFKVSPGDLRRWNGLTTNRLNPGDRLKVHPGS